MHDGRVCPVQNQMMKISKCASIYANAFSNILKGEFILFIYIFFETWPRNLKLYMLLFSEFESILNPQKSLKLSGFGDWQFK